MRMIVLALESNTTVVTTRLASTVTVTPSKTKPNTADEGASNLKPPITTIT